MLSALMSTNGALYGILLMGWIEPVHATPDWVGFGDTPTSELEAMLGRD